MKIYLAGGFTILAVKGRERETSSKFERWNRLISFYFKDYVGVNELFDIVKEERKENENISCG